MDFLLDFLSIRPTRTSISEDIITHEIILMVVWWHSANLTTPVPLQAASSRIWVSSLRSLRLPLCTWSRWLQWREFEDFVQQNIYCLKLLSIRTMKTGRRTKYCEMLSTLSTSSTSSFAVKGATGDIQNLLSFFIPFFYCCYDHCCIVW